MSSAGLPTVSSGVAMPERGMPCNVEAEMIVLGSMMLSKDAIEDTVAEFRKVGSKDCFYRPAHGRVYSTILNLYAKGEPTDPVAVGNELERLGELERVGGLPYLHSLISAVASPGNAEYYATIVREQFQLRSLVEAGQRITQLGYSSDGAEVEDVVSMAQSVMYEASAVGEGEESKDIADVLPSLVAGLAARTGDPDETMGIPTGFTELDAKLNGLRENQMIIVAARPGAGKSTLAMDFARSAALQHDIPTLYFTLEMTKEELATRMLAAESGIHLDRLIKGGLSTMEWAKVAQTNERIQSKPLVLDDSPNLTMAEIRSKCRRAKEQKGVGLIILDYLQLISSASKRSENRQQEVSEQSRAIKLLAKELHVPVIAVAQLNRGSEQRQDKRPMVSDLRESGSLEQDADVVLLIHRDDMYRGRGEKEDGKAEVIVGKQRSGPTGTVDLVFSGATACFVDPKKAPADERQRLAAKQAERKQEYEQGVFDGITVGSVEDALNQHVARPDTPQPRPSVPSAGTPQMRR